MLSVLNRITLQKLDEDHQINLVILTLMRIAQKEQHPHHKNVHHHQTDLADLIILLNAHSIAMAVLILGTRLIKHHVAMAVHIPAEAHHLVIFIQHQTSVLTAATLITNISVQPKM